jgi:hypothetical protein
VVHDLLCPTLVGRDSEWERLEVALDAAATGVGAAVALLGEAGIVVLTTVLRQHGSPGSKLVHVPHAQAGA